MILIKLLLSSITLLFFVGCAANPSSSLKAMDKDKSDHYKDGVFHNTADLPSKSVGDVLKILGRAAVGKEPNTQPNMVIPVQAISRTDLDNLSDDTLHIAKLGHSSILLKVYGEYWLLDPMFSERASPFQFLGPKRFHQPPISLEDLPPISKVLISHNHYDHLDKATVLALSSKTEQFLVPIGVDGNLTSWGISDDKITAFDWWQEQQTSKGLVAFTPSQHFSGRSLSDRDETLWGSWVIKTPTFSLYFSGDSGYFAGFKDIGNKYGPFDLTMVETGAYDKAWPYKHMRPEQSVQAHIDLKGKVMMPIHNCTFNLAFHPWNDPLDRVLAEAIKRDVNLSTPEFGQILSISDPTSKKRWWQKKY
ncbi:MBL fold metallo-hydrolase [Marinomonas transparens]|uniref:MBL fold metallo-hydrolase n=1 Tax=Marinomonas transparens TaxID=2795388 RepID=A0A934MZ67_9GAMM|nr:MBL fold metallo-hydrolase [Marinomonas transparens]MBJ7537220.1 MBL fold metallo-hydrolase [Marinomonas transparens]